MENEKSIWDKLGIIGTFTSSTLVVVFTAVVTYQTNLLKTKIENYKAVQEEGSTVGALIKELSRDTISTIKYDYAFLALERYLRNTEESGELKPQDKEMLVGFAQSLIYDRINFHHNLSENDMNRILIPSQFLQKNDSATLKKIQYVLEAKNKVNTLPLNGVTAKLSQVAPVSQVLDKEKSKSINIILKKIIYVQYADPNNIQIVREMQRKLIADGWIVPGIEHVKGNYSNIIKYFHDEDRTLAFQTSTFCGVEFRILHIKGYESKVPKGQLEVWIAKHSSNDINN